MLKWKLNHRIVVIFAEEVEINEFMWVDYIMGKRVWGGDLESSIEIAFCRCLLCIRRGDGE